MVLASGLEIEPGLELDTPQVRLSGLQAVQLPDEISTKPIEATNLTVQATRIALAGMHFGPGTELGLHATSSALPWLSASGAEGSLDLEAQPPLTMTIGGKPLAQVSTSDPVLISALAKGSAGNPLSLSGGTGHGLNFQDLPTAPTISSIRFGKRVAVSNFDQAFVSTVSSGTIQLLDVAREVKLDPRASVIIEGLQGHLFDFRPTDSGYAVGFSGIANRISIGPAGFPEDMTPTCLDYLYHQEWIKLMWAAALAGFAVLAKVRSWLGGKLD
jgi:hypothetical protein